jgi:hypothetical protein
MWTAHQWYDPNSGTGGSHNEQELEVAYPDPTITHLLTNYVLSGFQEYQKMCSVLGDGIDFSEIISHCCGIRLNRYSANTRMRRHFDHIHSLFDGAQKGIPVLSAIGILNDEYQGGNLVFFNDYEIKTNVGDLIIFPSCFLFPHQITEITDGTRHSFVSWGW